MKTKVVFNGKRFFVITLFSLFMFVFGFVVQADTQSRTVKRDNRLLKVKRKDVKQMLTLEKAKSLMVKQLYAGNIGKRGLFANPVLKKAGARIASWRSPNKITIDKDSWFFFVDEQPGANWEHKASYVVVNRETGNVKRVAAMSPPVEVMELKGLNNLAVTQMQVFKRNLTILRPKLMVRAIRLLKQNKYAVLICGGWNASSNYSRYWNDLQFMYKILKNKYHYTDSQIIVLYANGTHSPNGDFDGNGTNDIDYAATKANLTKVMNAVADNISSTGKFFFFATNHGGDDPGAYKSNLTLWGESIKDHEFGALTGKIKCKEAIYVLEPCFSGGLMDDILNAQPKPCGNPKVCVMTAARENQVSWGCDTEGSYDEYVYHWMSAVNGKTPTGAIANADTNGDGKIQMSEAHAYAVKKDSRDENPQIGSCSTGACDATLGFPPPMKEDCISFNYSKVKIQKIGPNYTIVDGVSRLFAFGNKLSEAQKALKIIKYYKMNRTCYVGRPNPSFTYLLSNGNAPSGSMSGEDCVSFNYNNLQIKKSGSNYLIVDGTHSIFNFGSKKSEAVMALQIIKKYKFTKSCYVGRPGPSFTYLRR